MSTGNQKQVRESVTSNAVVTINKSNKNINIACSAYNNVCLESEIPCAVACASEALYKSCIIIIVIVMLACALTYSSESRVVLCNRSCISVRFSATKLGKTLTVITTDVYVVCVEFETANRSRTHLRFSMLACENRSRSTDCRI